MKYNIATGVKDFDGQQIVENGKEVTFGDLIYLAAMQNLPEDQQKGKEEKMKRFTIARKVKSGAKGAVNLTDEDTVLIRQLAEKCFTVLFYGLLMEFLDSPIMSVVVAEQAEIKEISHGAM